MWKPSKNMKRTLADVDLGLNPYFRCFGGSEHGGQSRVLAMLVRRGLLTGNGLSEPWRVTLKGLDEGWAVALPTIARSR